MKRRDALKSIGLTLGYSVVVPSALSILQSCTSDIKQWTPIFFSKDEGIVIKNLVDLILPTTEATPGALDVNVPEFLDLYASNAYDEKRIEKYKNGIKSIVDSLPISEAGVEALKTEDYKKLLDTYLKPNKATENEYKKDNNLVYKSLLDLRNQSVWAYKTSKQIGENVLAYDPIPSVQIGCISIDEATGGKSWSL